MKFVRRDMGEAAEASGGGGRRALTRETIVLAGSAAGLILVFYFTVGWAVDSLLPLISYEREQRWFSGFRPVSSSGAAEESAGTRHREMAALLDRLTALPGVPSMEFSLTVLPDEKPNAFAFPGGTIGVTTGLMRLLDDDIAMAFILGHELGHFQHRDHLRGLGRRIGHTLVLTVLFGSGGGNLGGEHLTRFLDLSYSRRQEERADAFGLRLVYQSYGTVDGTEQLFAWLDRNRDLPQWASILSTHPDPAERIEKMRRLADELVRAASHTNLGEVE